MAVQEHRLSRKANDGSRNDMQDNGYDEYPHKSRDRRSDTRTTFLERDVDRYCHDPFYAKQMKRALKHQEGVGNPERGKNNYEEDKRRLVGTISTQLELTGAQKDRVRHLILDVINVNSFGRYTVEQVILATINVVVRRDDRWIEDEDAFTEMMNAVGIEDLQKMRRLRALVRDRI